MYLFEQVLRGNRLYYHGGPDNFKSFEARHRYHDVDSDEFNCVFLSTDRKFALDYSAYASGGSPDEDTTLYICKLTRSLNIFNPKSTQDYLKIYKFLEEDDLQKISGWRVDDWHNIRNWKTMEKPEVIRAILRAGFDGFCTREGGVENIAVFDPSVIQIIQKDSVEQLMKADDEIEFEFNPGAKIIPNDIVNLIEDELFSDIRHEYIQTWAERAEELCNDHNQQSMNTLFNGLLKHLSDPDKYELSKYDAMKIVKRLILKRFK